MIDFACILNSGTDEIGKNHAETDSKARSTNSRGGDDILRYHDFVNWPYCNYTWLSLTPPPKTRQSTESKQRKKSEKVIKS